MLSGISSRSLPSKRGVRETPRIAALASSGTPTNIHARKNHAMSFCEPFFQSVRLSFDEDDVDWGNEQVETDVRLALFDFADYL
jgi:hypothetical protein